MIFFFWGGGLIFGGVYTWRGLFSEFYGNLLLTAARNPWPRKKTIHRKHSPSHALNSRVRLQAGSIIVEFVD